MRNELKKLPNHIGFIIDGNGRWAQERGLTRSMGHKAGFKNLEKIVKECFHTHNIPYVSVYCFSTENWNRPEKEVNYLINLSRQYLNSTFLEKYPDVKLNIMGDISKFPSDIGENVSKVIDKTRNNKFTLNLCINYSGQDEIVWAVNNIIDKGLKKVDRDIIASHLYTQSQPPLDYVVRTSGEKRLSNFMLWQVAYAELYFPKVFWPAFSKKDLYSALLEYQSRDRRFGAIKE